MSESDDSLYSVDSNTSNKSSEEESESETPEWLDISKTYAEEPLAHTSDEEEDTEEDSEDGLCPTVLQSRFEERLNCRIPCHSNNFPRSRLRVTQKVKFYSDLETT